MSVEAILASASVPISELKVNPTAVIEAAEGMPVAVLNRNKPVAYLVPAESWEALLDKLEDIELAKLARERMGGPSVEVKLDDL